MSDDGCGCVLVICAGAAVLFFGGMWIARRTATEAREAVNSTVREEVRQALASAAASAAAQHRCEVRCWHSGSDVEFRAEVGLTPDQAKARANVLSIMLNDRAPRNISYLCQPRPAECMIKGGLL